MSFDFSSLSKKKEFDKSSASQHLVALWRGRCARKELAEKRALAGLLHGGSGDTHKAVFVPKYLDLAKVMLTDIPILVGVFVVALLQMFNVVGYILSFSMFIDDLTTTTSNGDPGMVKDETIILLFVLGLLAAVLMLGKVALLDLGGERVAVQMRSSLMRTVSLRPMTWFDDQDSTVLQQTLGPKVDEVRDNFFKAQVEMFWDMSMIFTGMMGLGLLAPPALGITVIFVPVLACGTAVHNWNLARLEKGFDAAQANCNFEASEFVNKIRPIRTCGTDTKELNDYLGSVNDMFFYFRKIALAESGYSGVNVFLSSSVLCVLIYFEGNLVEDSDVTVGSCLTCLAIAGVTLTYLQEFFQHFSEVMEGVRDSSYILEVLNRAGGPIGTKTPIAPGPKAVSGLGAPVVMELPREDDVHYLYAGQVADFGDASQGTVVYSGVNFAFPSRPRYKIMDALDFTMPAGKVTAVMGSSGCGKSTLMQLLLRFYMPADGTITIDGVKVQDFDRSFCQQVGYVAPTPVMFHGSIRTNIAYGCDLSDDLVIQAAKFADAHRFISLLPDGYDTHLGTGGLKLSDGQMQRIAISRMFARNPSVCCLDDPCGDFDALQAASIRTAVRRMLRYPVRRTGFIIAREPEDMEFADYIAVLEGGKIADCRPRADMAADASTDYYKLLNPVQ